MPIFSAEDRDFWQRNGYIVVHNAVPSDIIEPAKEAIWDFLGMEPDVSQSWYPEPPKRGIMVEIYQHQALWNNRQFPRVYQAFAEILATEHLWVSIDRASMNPPQRTNSADNGNRQAAHSTELPIPLHWDYALQLHGDGTPTVIEGNIESAIPFWVQGVLYLTDTTVDGGAFICVPGVHRKIGQWMQTLPQDMNPLRPNKQSQLFLDFAQWLEALPADAEDIKRELMSLGTKPISAQAGDLIIWHSGLPHGADRNRAEHPRIAQYMTMFPAQEQDEKARNHRLKVWRNYKVVNRINAFRVKSGRQQKKSDSSGRLVQLSSLGRKLLGLDYWAN